MFKTRKILPLALTLTMLLSAVFCTGAVASADTTSDTPAVKLLSVSGDADTFLPSLGTNIITDPTINLFDGDTYKAYYEDETKGGTVANADAIWAKAVHEWQAFSNGAAGAVYRSPKARGLLSNETALSHTMDGSGVIFVDVSEKGRGMYLPINSTGSANTNKYFLLTFWIKGAEASDALAVAGNNRNTEISKIEGVSISTEWQRITLLLYTGNQTYNTIFMYSYVDLYIDDFALYKLDDAYGTALDASGKFAAPEDIVYTSEVTAAGEVNLTAADGWFVPYGAAVIGSTALEKLENGSFNATTTGTVKYTQFKYPSGIVGTFGVSVKTTGDTGIQFGSLVTDNLNTTAHGTLVIRGDFDAFCATLPTYTREQIFKTLYDNLKDKGIASGEAVNITNGEEKIAVMYVDRTKYMWKNSENTELQYAVRVYNVEQNFADVEFTAVGYVTTTGDELVFSNTTKSGVYSDHLSN